MKSSLSTATRCYDSYPSKKIKSKQSPADVNREQAAADVRQCEAAADPEPVAAAEATPPPEPPAPTVSLVAEILEAPKLHNAVKDGSVVEAIDDAVAKFEAKLVVAALQASLKRMGVRTIVDRTSGHIGKFTCSRINRIEKLDKFLEIFRLTLADEVAKLAQA